MAFTGIARPEVFQRALRDLGGEVVGFRAYKDHHFFRPDEIRRLSLERERSKADFLITTEKDWVRIEGFASRCPETAFLGIRFDITSDRERFFTMLKEKIDTALKGPLS